MESRRPAQYLKEALRMRLWLLLIVFFLFFVPWRALGAPLWALPLMVIGAVLVDRESRREIRNLFLGARGEMRVARLLAPLESRGYLVLHDLETGFGNIDHAVVGPPGVFAIETKAWRGRVHLKKGPTLYCNNHDHTAAVKQAAREAIELRRRIGRVGIGGWVQAFIVLTDTELPRGPIKLSRVTVVQAADLAREIESRPPSLTATEVARAASAILSSSPSPGAAPLATSGRPRPPRRAWP